MGMIPEWAERLPGADSVKLQTAKDAAGALRALAMEHRKQADSLEVEANAVEQKAFADEVTLHTATVIKETVENKPKEASPVEEAPAEEVKP